MTLKLVDLRSDTVTQPTPAMRDAMQAAALGDDVFAGDPSVNALQGKIAALLGFEAARFVPTGTQSNLCAMLSHCQRGDEYIVGQMAHCYRWEGGGAAVFGSVQPQPLNHQADGSLSLADIEAAIKPDDAHFARTRLLALENTLGGKLLPFAYVQAATELAKAHGLSRHLTRPPRGQSKTSCWKSITRSPPNISGKVTWAAPANGSSRSCGRWVGIGGLAARPSPRFQRARSSWARSA